MLSVKVFLYYILENYVCNKITSIGIAAGITIVNVTIVRDMKWCAVNRIACTNRPVM